MQCRKQSFSVLADRECQRKGLPGHSVVRYVVHSDDRPAAGIRRSHQRKDSHKRKHEWNSSVHISSHDAFEMTEADKEPQRHEDTNHMPMGHFPIPISDMADGNWEMAHWHMVRVFVVPHNVSLLPELRYNFLPR